MRKTDPEMAKKLGLHSAAVIERQYQAVQSPENSDPIAESDSKVRQQSKTSNQRNIANYGPREQKSLKMLSSWSVPGAYDFTPTTAAAKFMISLAPDPQKMEEFNKHSGKELQKTTGILPWQAKYLTSGNRAMVRLAVKPNNTNAAREAAIELFTNGSFGKAYAEEARKYAHDPSADQKLTTFLELHGFKTTPDAVLEAVKRLRQSSLLPWHQVYHTKFGNLEIDCQRATYKGNIIWNEVPIQGFTFTSSTLSWKAEGVNESSAALSFTTQDNLPMFNGKYWKKGEKEPSTANIVGTIENFVSPLSVWRGNYRTIQLVHGSQTKGAPGPELSINFSAANPDGIVKLGGKPLVNFKFNQKKLSWENGEITFFVEKATVSHPPIEKFYGKIWAADQSKTSHFNFWGTKDATFLKPWSGRYKTYIGPNGKEKPSEELIVNGGLTVETSTVQFGKTINKFQFNNPVLSWEAGNGNDNNAQIRFEVFKNGSLGFEGMMWQAKEAKPMETNFEGVVDSIYLDAWCACYYTKVRETGDKVMDGEPFSITKSDNKCYRITYKGEEISNWNYSGAKRNLHWSSKDNNTNGSIQFYVPPPEKGTRLCFFGKVAEKGATIPVKTNIWGSTVPFPGVSGNSTQQLEQLLANILTIALIEFLKYAWKKYKRWLKSKMDGEPKEQQEQLKKEYEDVDEKVNQLEDELNEESAKFDELEPEVDPSPEPPTPPDPAPEPPSNEVVDTDTDTTDVDTDTDTDVDVDTDIDIVVDICSLM